MHSGEKRHQAGTELGDTPSFVPPLILPPAGLCFADIELIFDKYFEPPPVPGAVPFYHFKMADSACNQVGHLNFRVGRTRHILETAGHIGYFVHPEFRGNGNAYKACLAVAPFVCTFFNQVIITAEIDAAASIRTIERLGAEYLDERDVPTDDPAYAAGARRKRRYLWRL